MSKVLIVGAAGYVGSGLYRHLEAVGHDVAGTDLAEPRRGNPGKILLEGDMIIGSDWDAVIWLGGAASVEEAERDSRGCIAEGIGTLRDLAAIIPEQTRLIHASSGSVCNGKFKARENATLRAPVTMYDAVKQGAEMIAPLIHRNSVALRFGTVCGVSPNMRWDTFLNRMVRNAIENGVVLAEQRIVMRSVLGMEDLCCAVERLVEGKGHPGIYHLASASGSIAEIAEAVAWQLAARVDVWTGRSSDYSFTMDCTKARRDLEWNPHASFRSLIEEIAGLFTDRAMEPAV